MGSLRRISCEGKLAAVVRKMRRMACRRLIPLTSINVDHPACLDDFCRILGFLVFQMVVSDDSLLFLDKNVLLWLCCLETVIVNIRH